MKQNVKLLYVINGLGIATKILKQKYLIKKNRRHRNVFLKYAETKKLFRKKKTKYDNFLSIIQTN